MLTDRTVYEGDRRYLDPHLATSAVDQALKQFRIEPGEENLRRRCSIVLRSAAIRNVHDVVLALGLGANGVCPYVLLEVICVDDYRQDTDNVCAALRKGIEKVISTIGIHESRGYARQFSSIGIKPELAEIFQTPAFAASSSGGVGFAELDADADERHRILRRRRGREAGEDVPLLPEGLQGRDRRRQRHGELRGLLARRCATSRPTNPISMRHIMALKSDRDRRSTRPSSTPASATTTTRS